MIESPRLDLLVATYGRELTIALLVIGAVAVVGTGLALANQSTTTTTQEVGSETVSTEVGTSAVVVRDGLWNESDVLEDSSVYLLNDTPVVTLEPRTTVPDDDAVVTHDLTVRLEATRDGESFYEESEAVETTDVVVEDGVARSNGTVDVAELADRKRDLERELDGVGDVEISIRLDVAYETASNDGTLNASTPIRVTEDAYWFDGIPSDSNTHRETAQVEASNGTSPALVGGLLFVAVLSFGAAAFVAGRSSIDVEAARQAVHERRYAEWISRGSIPMWIGEHHVELDSLEDVVDVAIDTNVRVVHDRQRGLFAVVDDDVVYYYSERGSWEQTAWPNFDLGRAQRSDIGLDGPPVNGPIDFDGSIPGDGESGDGPIPGDSERTGESPAIDETASMPEDLPDPDDEDAWEQL